MATSSNWGNRVIEKSANLGTLYLVGTPIGNRSDWSPRAQQVLGQVETVLAEDTRVTGLLLRQAGIMTPLWSFHAHNTQERIPQVLERLLHGSHVALVSDRGMPTISDPGQELVDACWREQVPLSIIPGPSAGTTAYAASGFHGPYAFWGFLPRHGSERQKRLKEVGDWPYVGILYESPHHMQRTLKDLLTVLEEDRLLLLAREMTKLHEEFWRGSLKDLYNAEREWRGECVLVVSPNKKKPGSLVVSWSQLISRVEDMVTAGVSASEAIRQVAQEADVSRRELYQRLHNH